MAQLPNTATSPKLSKHCMHVPVLEGITLTLNVTNHNDAGMKNVLELYLSKSKYSNGRDTG